MVLPRFVEMIEFELSVPGLLREEIPWGGDMIWAPTGPMPTLLVLTKPNLGVVVALFCPLLMVSVSHVCQEWKSSRFEIGLLGYLVLYSTKRISGITD